MKRLVLTILVVSSLAMAANAQTYRGAINGAVTDPSGAMVPNATVKATERATGIDHSTVTTSDGLFAFQDLPVGTYKVIVTATGFAVLTVDNVPVAQGAIYTLSAKLSMAQGAITQVEVSAAALTLDTTTETQTTLVSGDDLQSLPQNGRDFSQMIALVPGFGGYNVGGTGGGGGSINGTRWDQVNWQMDGVDNSDLWWNIPSVNQGGVSGIAGIILPTDAIDQFSVQTQASPESGRNPGGTVDLALKSGGNDFHGTVYDYHRNEAFAAKSPFVAVKNRNRNYNYGFSVGGPILKDRLFFFTTFEKQRFSIGLPGEGTEPSTAYQNAALNVLNNCVNPPSCTSHYGTYAPVSPSPISTKLLATLWPSSILSGAAQPNNYVSPIPESGFSYNGLAKFDYKINDKNNLSFHWFIGTGNQSAPVGGTVLALAASQIPFYYEVAPIHVQNYAVALNSAFTPKLTNQLLLGVNYFKQNFNDANHSFDVSNCCGLNLAPNFSANGVTGAPQIVIGPVSGGGFDQTGLTPPKGRQDVTGHITDAVSYTFGKHQFRFGGEYRRVQVDEFYHEGALGKLLFDGTQGPWFGNTTVMDSNILPLADFLGGYLETATTSSTSITLGNTERLIHIKTFSLFAQDAWQWSPKLTFNYGIRWDYEGPPGDGKNDLSVFIPSKGGLVTQGSGGIDSIYKKIYTNFSPRIGFAYQPKANGDLVVRAGFGVFFDTPRLNPFFDMHAPNGPSQGVEANPAGTIPVTTVTAVSLNTSGNAGQGTPWTSNPIFQPGPACPTGAASCGASYNLFTVTQNFHTPYTYNFNLNIEKAFGKSLLWQVGYVGSASHHLLTLADINQPALGIGARPFATQFPSFNVIDELQTAGNSNYNSLQTVLKVREWHRLSGQFIYSLSHALDDMTQARGNLPQDSLNLKGDYSNSDTDSRHNFKALLNYDLPDGTRWKRLTSGWQLSSLVVLWTGQPFTVFSSGDTATGEGTQRANRVPGVNPFSGVNHSIVNVGGGIFEQWFNPAAFVNPPAGAFGTSPRNGIYGPGFADVDFSVVKNTPITERVKAQFRIEMFNLFNRTNLATPSGTIGSSLGQSADTIGDFYGAPGIGPGEKFNMQLALKIIF